MQDSYHLSFQLLILYPRFYDSESEASADAALSIIHLLSHADIDVKLHASRKVRYYWGCTIVDNSI